VVLTFPKCMGNDVLDAESIHVWTFCFVWRNPQQGCVFNGAPRAGSLLFIEGIMFTQRLTGYNVGRRRRRRAVQSNTPAVAYVTSDRG